jgi:hypothetical protein
MKTQRRLRLRQVGKHHLTRDNVMTGRAWARTIGDGTIGRALVRAFEYDCAPKHYDTGIQEPCYTMDYVTGKITWHGPFMDHTTYRHRRHGITRKHRSQSIVRNPGIRK